MTRRLLLIQESRDPWPDLHDVLGDGFAYEGRAWDAFDPDVVDARRPDLVIFFIPNDPSSLARCAALAARRVAAPTLAILAGDADAALVRAASLAADDFLVCPVREGECRERVHRLAAPAGGEAATPVARLVQDVALASLVGRAPAFLDTVARIPVAARSGSPVLITGETGTGKELCARAIHHLGPRARHPFVPLDCGAVPDQLFENEVFGHARGAFTDARTEQRGLLAMADGGTVFLDEVDALSPAAQSKLLRFLQERTFKPLGSDRFVRADVNVLSATNRDLGVLVREQRFRADLFFRLNVLSLHLVPLRARRSDIALLARHFVGRICAEQRVPRKVLSPGALLALDGYAWPGNVRELWNVLQRAVTFTEGQTILPANVSFTAASGPPAADVPGSSFRQARMLAVESFERAMVEDLLQRHRGNVTQAAREAKKDRRAFGRLVKKYGIPK